MNSLSFLLDKAEVVEDIENYEFPESMAAGRFDFAKATGTEIRG